MEKYALLIIDMQNDFVLNEKTAVKGAKHTLLAIKKAMQVCHEKNIPVFHIIRSYDKQGNNAEIFRREAFKQGMGICVEGTQGAEIVAEIKPSEQDIVLIKPRFSAFFATNLHNLLQEKNITHLLIAGTQYPNCIRATAVDALCYDYITTVLTDCCSAQTEEIAQANILDFQNMGIICTEFKNIF